MRVARRAGIVVILNEVGETKQFQTPSLDYSTEASLDLHQQQALFLIMVRGKGKNKISSFMKEEKNKV